MCMCMCRVEMVVRVLRVCAVYVLRVCGCVVLVLVLVCNVWCVVSVVCVVCVVLLLRVLCCCCGCGCCVVCGLARLGTRKTPPCVGSKRLCVPVQSASVCGGKTPACVVHIRPFSGYTRRRPDRTHGDVLNLHTEGFSAFSVFLALSSSLSSPLLPPLLSFSLPSILLLSLLSQQR